MLKKLLAATALTGALAVSATALELGADASIGLSFEDGIAVSADVAANADADSATPTQENLLNDGYVVVADSGFVGNTVETSDGVMLGTVVEVYGKPDTAQYVRIEVDEASGLERPDAFWLTLASDADADGTLVLPMTSAEFATEVEAQLGTEG